MSLARARSGGSVTTNGRLLEQLDVRPVDADVAVQVMAQLADAQLPVNVVTQPEEQAAKRRR